MSQLVRSIQSLVNFTGIGYALALVGLLLIRLLGQDHHRWIALLVNFMPYFFVPVFILVIAALLFRAYFALAVTAPLALVGLALYAPLFLTKPTGDVSDQGLTVLTFNVSDTNRQRDDVIAWLRAKSADVVLLQEVAPDWFAPIRQTLTDLYPYQVTQLTEQGARGNLTLSRIPFASGSAIAENYHLETPVVLNVYHHSIAIYNVSLSAPVNGSGTGLESTWTDLALHYDDNYRDIEIARLLHQLRSESLPFLVAGDFNMSDQASVYASLAAQMGDSFREAGVGLGATWRAFQGDGLMEFIPPLIRIDYIWHSREFQAVYAEVGPNVGSDHLPVFVTLNLAPSSASEAG